MHKAALLAFSLVLACHPASDGSAVREASAPASSNRPDPSPAADAATGVLPDAGSAPALTRLADSSNAFGLDVYSVARRGRTNLALSPLSLSMALTMAWAGARGETAAQMKSALRVKESLESDLDEESKLSSWLRAPSQAATLRVANRLFGEKSYAFERAFLDSTSAAFGSPLEPLDFVSAPDASRRAINDWVASRTAQHIEDLVPPRGVSSDTRLVLANAIYFLGRWEHPFKPHETKPAAFHLSSTQTENVATMHQVEQLRFAHVDGLKVVEAPYVGGELAMAFVLPDARDGLDALESRLSAATLAGWLDALTSARVQVSLPRFDINPIQSLALRGILTSLGMPLAFDREKADFTGMASSPRPEDRLFLGDVFHRAFVKVDESGTEAAAATGATIRRSMLRRPEPSPEEFTADHPFLFFLRDSSSGTILFMGRVGNPNGRRL
jgi:serpin B